MPGAHESSVFSLDWHPLGHILASGSNDHTTRFWTRNRPGDAMNEHDAEIGEGGAATDTGSRANGGGNLGLMPSLPGLMGAGYSTRTSTTFRPQDEHRGLVRSSQRTDENFGGNTRSQYGQNQNTGRAGFGYPNNANQNGSNMGQMYRQQGGFVPNQERQQGGYQPPNQQHPHPQERMQRSHPVPSNSNERQQQFQPNNRAGFNPPQYDVTNGNRDFHQMEQIGDGNKTSFSANPAGNTHQPREERNAQFENPNRAHIVDSRNHALQPMERLGYGQGQMRR